MEDIIKIPSRIIPGGKLFTNFGLGTAGLTGAGIFTSAKLFNEDKLTLIEQHEKEILNMDTKHIQQLKTIDEQHKKETDILRQYTPSAQRARAQSVQQYIDSQERFYERFGGRPELYSKRGLHGRRRESGARAVHKLCLNTDNLNTIMDNEIKQYCLGLRK